MYHLKYKKRFDDSYNKLNSQIKLQIHKKIQKLKEEVPRRHLKYGLPYFVEEVGQYRIIYKFYEQEKIIELFFVGDHKDYEKFLASLC